MFEIYFSHHIFLNHFHLYIVICLLDIGDRQCGARDVLKRAVRGSGCFKLHIKITKTNHVDVSHSYKSICIEVDYLFIHAKNIHYLCCSNYNSTLTVLKQIKKRVFPCTLQFHYSI